MERSQIINDLGEDRAHYFNAVAPPIMQASNFAFDTVDQLAEAFKDEMASYLYSRGINPTVDILRRKLAALDGAEDCLILNSGAAATFAAVMANVKAGDHVVCVQEPYSWTNKLFSVMLPRFGVATTFVEGKTPDEWKAAARTNTVLFYFESPNSWTYALQPLRELAVFAKERNILTVIDNTYCTGIYQNVMDLGIDIAMQTATKYIGGHSDTIGGVITGSKAMMKKIFDSEYLTVGSGIQPFNAWLLLRGLRTLPLRLQRINESTQKVVEYLAGHPKIEKIIFPFHRSFDQYDLATQQMKAAFGLMTIVLKDEKRASVTKFCESLEAFLIAVSWGGHESLVVPRCASIPAGSYDPAIEKHRHIRLYIGLEDADYLIQDLGQALAQIS